MGKLLKFLKPYAGVAIICILVVQAYCDLSLPTYTSDIVNVGIQQGGIDETVPDTISKKDLNHLLLLVPSDKQELVKNAYTKSTKKYDYKGTVMELKSSVKEDDKKMEKISDILGKPMLLAAGFDSGSDMTQRIEDQMRTNMKKQVEAKQAEAKAQMEKAQKVGFTTTSTFNRNFKKYLNTSPYQWKISPENYERKLLNYNISALKGW